MSHLDVEHDRFIARFGRLLWRVGMVEQQGGTNG